MIFIFCCGYVPSAVADELVLLKGKGAQVCEKHLENLNMLTLRGNVCDREEYPEDSIKRPKWQDLDLEANKELVKKIEKFLTNGDQFSKSEIYDDEKQFEHYMKYVIKSNYLLVSKIDIDNDGKLETVCLYSERRCMEPGSPYARALLLLTGNGDLIDIRKTEPLLQNPFGNLYDVRGKAVNHLYQLYDVFFFNNQTFFDKWNARDRTLTVYELKGNITKEVCGFKYSGN